MNPWDDPLGRNNLLSRNQSKMSLEVEKKNQPLELPKREDYASTRSGANQFIKDRSLVAAEIRTQENNVQTGLHEQATQKQYDSIPEIPKPKLQIGGMSPKAQAKVASGLGVAQGFVDMIMALKGPGKQPTPGTSPGEGALSGVVDEDGYVPTYY
tara:strand:- start:46 stop:510 length:465 start_codon:yes stop_codon:yes gene_type:complete